MSSENKDETEMFSEKQKLRKLAMSRLVLKEILKGVVEKKENDPGHKERNTEMNEEQNKRWICR